MPLSCSGDGGGCLFSVARRRGVGGRSLSTQTGPSTDSPATWETAAAAPAGPLPAPGPAHRRHFAPNFTIGGGLQLPFSPPSSRLSAELGSTAARDIIAAKRDASFIYLFIYLPRPSPTPPPPAPSLTNVDDGVRPHRNALKYPGEKPEHQHFHFQPLAQHISPGLVERHTGGKKKKGARAGRARQRARGGDAQTPPSLKKIPKSPSTPRIFQD